MLFFGHIGITVGVAKVSRLSKLDYRMVLLGSLLPDIIDKPLFLILGNSFSLSGRDYGHTLLFNLILLSAGLFLARKGGKWLFSLALGSLMHLIFDQIWHNMETLFWPLLGPLVGGDTSVLMDKLWAGLVKPEVFVPELAGLAVMGWLLYRLLKIKGIRRFLTTGEIG